jgi:hypothetical protein
MRDPSDAAEEKKELKEKTVQTARLAEERLGDVAERIANKIDFTKRIVANNLDSVASMVHKQTDNVSRFGHRTAEDLKRAADATREIDARGVVREVRRAMEDHPIACLVSALAAGIVFGRAIWRR